MEQYEFKFLSRFNGVTSTQVFLFFSTYEVAMEKAKEQCDKNNWELLEVTPFQRD